MGVKELKKFKNLDEDELELSTDDSDDSSQADDLDDSSHGKKYYEEKEGEDEGVKKVGKSVVPVCVSEKEVAVAQKTRRGKKHKSWRRPESWEVVKSAILMARKLGGVDKVISSIPRSTLLVVCALISMLSAMFHFISNYFHSHLHLLLFCVSLFSHTGSGA